jgi:hypothetical protein
VNAAKRDSTEGLAGALAEVFGLTLHAPPVALEPFIEARNGA